MNYSPTIALDRRDVARLDDDTSQLRKLAYSCVTIAGAVSLLSLVIGAFVPGAMPAWYTMNANSAIAFAFAAGALGLTTFARSGAANPVYTGASQWMAAATAAIAIGTLVVFGVVAELNFDEFLLQDSSRMTGAIGFGQIPLQSIVGLVLVAAAIAHVQRPRPRTTILYLLAAPVAGLSVLTFCAMSYRVPASMGFAGPHVLSMPSAICFLALSLGTLASVGPDGPLQLLVDKSPGGRLLRKLLVWIVATPIVIGGLWVTGQQSGLYGEEFVMPGMGGRELAEIVQAGRPEVKVLFATGYTDDMILQHRVLERGVALLHKPYTAAALADKVRETLDSVVVAA